MELLQWSYYNGVIKHAAAPLQKLLIEGIMFLFFPISLISRGGILIKAYLSILFQFLHLLYVSS